MIHKSIKSDILILLLAGVVFSTYQYEKNLSPEFLLFFMQIVILWFVLKIIYFFFPKLKVIVLPGLLLWGVIEAVWGLGQLYNYLPIKHSLFRTTGSFYNPGPYGGFIALMLPIALHYWLVYRRKNILFSYLFLSLIVVFLMVLPATLSRTAWFAAVVGCGAVLLLNRRFMVKLRLFWKRYRRQRFLGITILSLFLLSATYGTYHIKKDSANGRLFMWKITALAIHESPVKGVGLGGFPAAYAKAQMRYFKSGKGNEAERLVAGSPEYAFNEYLQILLEQGLFGFVLFLLLSFFIIKEGIRNNQIGASTGFVSLLVFAFASYPYQLWQFPIVWVLLGTVCTSGSDGVIKGKGHIVLLILLIFVLGFASTICASRQKFIFKAKNEWKNLKPFYTMKAYDNVVESYDSLYMILNYDPKFVFEYGMTLNGTNRRVKADSVFLRGLEIN